MSLVELVGMTAVLSVVVGYGLTELSRWWIRHVMNGLTERHASAAIRIAIAVDMLEKRVAELETRGPRTIDLDWAERATVRGTEMEPDYEE